MSVRAARGEGSAPYLMAARKRQTTSDFRLSDTSNFNRNVCMCRSSLMMPCKPSEVGGSCATAPHTTVRVRRLPPARLALAKRAHGTRPMCLGDPAPHPYASSHVAKVNISRQHDETQSCLRETTAADSRSAAHTLSGRPERERRLTSAQRPTPLMTHI